MSGRIRGRHWWSGGYVRLRRCGVAGRRGGPQGTCGGGPRAGREGPPPPKAPTRLAGLLGFLAAAPAPAAGHVRRRPAGRAAGPPPATGAYRSRSAVRLLRVGRAARARQSARHEVSPRRNPTQPDAWHAARLLLVLSPQAN